MLDAQAMPPYGAAESPIGKPMADRLSAGAPSPGAPEFSARATGVLVLADGTAFEGHAFGAATSAVGEVCFNTAMTGYQEIQIGRASCRERV